MATFKTGIKTMFKMCGTNCSVTVDNQTSDFKGIFDQSNELETVDGVSVILMGSSLTVEKHIGMQLTRGLPVMVGGVEWYVREVLFMDDGETAKVSITKDDSQC